MRESPSAPSYEPVHVLAANATRLHEQWPHVAVRAVDTLSALRGTGRLKVQACVHLGALTPADVEVELVRTARRPRARELPPDAVADFAGGDRRMWSTRAYANGCYLFEATVDAPDASLGDALRVRVRPARRLPGTERLPSVCGDVGAAARRAD